MILLADVVPTRGRPVPNELGGLFLYAAEVGYICIGNK
jgi:hypothetical protein